MVKSMNQIENSLSLSSKDEFKSTLTSSFRDNP